MPSSASGARRLLTFETWNKKLHYYLGLYFLLFLWLFSFTGLLLNHPRWMLSRTNGACAWTRPRRENRFIGVTVSFRSTG